MKKKPQAKDGAALKVKAKAKPAAKAKPKPSKAKPAPKKQSDPRVLDAKEQAFVEHYLISLNATESAIKAGYAASTADSKAWSWVGKSRDDCPPAKRHVWDAVQVAIQARTERNQVDADYVLRRLADIDAMDVKDILNDDGSAKPISGWPVTWRTTLSGFDISEIFDGDGNATGMLKKIKWPDKVRNLELLGKHVQVQAWKEAIEVTLSPEYDKRLDAAIARKAKLAQDRQAAQ